jgi:hypothetical protein
MAKEISGRLIAYLLIMSCAAPALIGIFGVLYTSYAIRQSNQKMCHVLNTIYNPAPVQNTPANPRGLQFQKDLQQLRLDYRCEGK